MADKEQTPPSFESRRSNTVLKRAVPKRAPLATAPSHGQAARAASSQSHGVEMESMSISVHKELQEPMAEVDEEEEDNSFDRNDEMSESIPSVDGSDDDVVDMSKTDAQKGKRQRKRLKAGAGVQLSPSKCKVGRGKRADCWNHFMVVTAPSKSEKGVPVTTARCLSCQKSYVYHQGGSTTRLNRHLAKCGPYLTKVAKAKAQLAQGTLNFGADSGSAVVNPIEYDHDHTRLLVAKMIIVHKYSFRMVEHKWFNILMKWMNSNYEWIGRRAIKNECLKVYESEKEQLKASLKEAESISLTTDLWTSNQNLQYMCLVAHYIDANWILQCRVLNFVELDPPHTGIVIAQAIFDCLVEWKIEDKVMTVTLDNASNNDTAVSNLESKLLARNNTRCDKAYFHVRCAAHIVNLVVNDGLEPIDSLISNLRNTVKYFKRSPSRMYKFIEVCHNYSIKIGKGLALDVKTRWSSTYRMLEACIDYKSALVYYAEADSKYQWKPTENEWALFEKIRPVLKKMASATTAFSGSIYPTANVFYPYIVSVKIALKEAHESGDIYLMNMAAAMLDKFDKYWEVRNNLMVIATILDPRFKMRYIVWCFGQLYDPLRCAKEVDDITKELEKLYKKYNKVVESVDSGKNSAQSPSCSKDTSNALASVVPSGFQSYLASSATEVSKSELLIYLEEPNVSIDDKKFDLLNFWKVNTHRFPVVAAMAKSFLAVPASSVSSESTFSTGGRILDDYRSSLKPATVQALVCASSWIKGASKTDSCASASASVTVEKDEDDDVESVEFPNCVVASN